MPDQKLMPSYSQNGATSISSSVRFQVNAPKQSRYGFVEVLPLVPNGAYLPGSRSFGTEQAKSKALRQSERFELLH